MRIVPCLQQEHLRGIAVAMTMWSGSVGIATAQDTSRVLAEPSHHFTMTIPSGWLRVDEDVVAGLNEEAARQGVGDRVRITDAFQYENSETAPYPYVVVQIGNESDQGFKATYEDLEKILVERYGSIREEAELALPDIAKLVSLGTPVFDSSRNRFVQYLSGQDPQLGTTKGISIGFIGSRNWVYLHCYTLESDFSEHLKQFYRFAEAFQWNPGYEFVASKNKGSWVEKWIAGVLVSLVATAIGGKKLLGGRKSVGKSTV